ncbi:MAG: hypothetical protein H6739_08060 [Alphaproteobacteria bacterium]|nr:hypothetical protein [Alphaproteobacteria bacterium]
MSGADQPPFTRLSEAPLWRAHRRFYADRGPEVWAEGVLPSQITTSVATAWAYANMLVEWLEATAPDPAHPVYVVELGSGPGVLAARLVRELEALLLPDAPQVVVVLTDISEQNLAAWQADPELAAWARAGRVDFARLDLDAPGPLILQCSNRRLAPGEQPNPVALIANYVLDCVPCDLFRAHGGHLFEVGVRTTRDPETGAWRLTVRPGENPVEGGVYDDPLLDGLLATYAAGLPDAWPLVPARFLRTLRWLMGLGGRGALLLACDKACRSLEEWGRAGPPHVATHGETASFLANFHAVEALFGEAGGIAMHSRSALNDYTLSAFATGLSAPAEARVRRAFRRWLDDFGPADAHRLGLHVFGVDPPALRGLLVTLRLAHHDPWVFMRLADRILAQLPHSTGPLRADLSQAMDEVLARAGQLALAEDVSFAVGRVLCGLGRSADARACFQRSLAVDGPHRATFFNLYVAAAQLGRLDEALGWMAQAIEAEGDAESTAMLADALRQLAEAGVQGPAADGIASLQRRLSPAPG